MLKTKKSFLIATAIFVVAEIILGCFIQEVSGKTYGILTVLSVLLACVFAILNLKKNAMVILTVIALVFTVFADVFLSGLFEGKNNQLIAMLFFCVVQICYFIRLYLNHELDYAKGLHISSRAFASIGAVLATVLVLRDGTNALAIVSLFYYANLIVNVVTAFTQTKKSVLLAVGLLLFACCDFFVGLSVMASDFLVLPEGSLLDKLNNTGVNIAWIFYVPSQTLLALSINEKMLFSKA